jgi:hypothetical protein
VQAAVDETGTTADTWAEQPLQETNTEPEENVQVIIRDSRVESPTEQPVQNGYVEAAPEIQATGPATTSELVLWIRETAADESDVQEGFSEVQIP